jgi:polysaccharide pyruvyl transferase CsaB
MSTPLPATTGEPKAARPRLLLTGFYGVRNLGDELMLRCLVRWLAPAAPHVTVLSERPQDSEQTNHLPAILNVPLLGQWSWYDAWLRGAAWRLLGRMRTFDACLGGCGDVLRDDRGWRHLSFATEKYFVARAMGKPWYVLNAGIAPPTTRYGRATLRYVLAGARLVVVRDRRAYDVARAARGPDATFYAADIVMALPRLFPVECAPAGPRPTQPYVLVCLRGNPDTFGRFAMPEERLRELARALDAIAGRGLKVVFLPLQQHPELEDDDTLHRAVAARMVRREAVSFAPWTTDLPALSRLFRNAGLVVAMRLHAAVLAEAFGSRTAVLAYDRKLVEFAGQRGAPVIDASLLDRPDACRARLFDALDGERTGPVDAPPHDWLSIDFPW